MSDTYKVWSVLPEEEDVSQEKLAVNLSTGEPVIFSVADPRLPAFSHRLVLLQGISGRLADDINYVQKRNCTNLWQVRVFLFAFLLSRAIQ